jgi:hypothetical protein
VQQWTKDDVYAWAVRAGSTDPLIGELAGQLYDNDIDGSVLLALHEGDLNDLGITSLGKKKKLMAAIHALRQPQPAPSIMPQHVQQPPVQQQDHFSLF